MNTERLHAIAKAVLDDLRTTKTESTLEQLVGSLRNQVNQPQAPQFQQQVSSHLGALNTQLAAAPSNSFSPTWKQALQELGLYDLLGEKLQVALKRYLSAIKSLLLSHLKNCKNCMHNSNPIVKLS